MKLYSIFVICAYCIYAINAKIYFEEKFSDGE